jgi:hypothetical protein
LPPYKNKQTPGLAILTGQTKETLSLTEALAAEPAGRPYPALPFKDTHDTLTKLTGNGTAFLSMQLTHLGVISGLSRAPEKDAAGFSLPRH